MGHFGWKSAVKQPDKKVFKPAAYRGEKTQKSAALFYKFTFFYLHGNTHLLYKKEMPEKFYHRAAQGIKAPLSPLWYSDNSMPVKN
jgi:hypothetical protein